MTKSTQSELEQSTWLKGEYVGYWAITWSIIALGCYLIFSDVEPGTTRPIWFIVTTTSLEQIALIISGCLCLRNWHNQSISSGREVWLLLAISMFAFFTGNLCFLSWEVIWGLDPAASAGNPCFVLFYLVLIAGVRLAILNRDVQLARQQWMVVTSVATFGLVIGCWLTTVTARAALLPVMPATPMSNLHGEVIAISNSRGMTARVKVPAIATQKINQQPETRRTSPPAWVLGIDRWMQPLVSTFNLFYVLCDLVLLIFAAILLLGFWGGHLGSPWRMIAQAVLCFYIADTWFAYANNQVQGYESGFIMEVFWIFGIVQFGVAAALEFDNSIRARRLARRRTAIR